MTALVLIAIGFGWLSVNLRKPFAALRWHAMAGPAWKALHAGPLLITVPSAWGALERSAGTGLSVGYRPRSHRVDGDAVWYGSAVELHLGLEAAGPAMSGGPMTEHRRVILHGSQVIHLTLRIANGVAPRQRKAALKALRGARVIRDLPFNEQDLADDRRNHQAATKPDARISMDFL